MAFNVLLRRLEVDAVPHGFLSSFRDWAAECSGASWAGCESALAHNVGNATEQAYMRSDLFEQTSPALATVGRLHRGLKFRYRESQQIRGGKSIPPLCRDC